MIPIRGQGALVTRIGSKAFFKNVVIKIISSIVVVVGIVDVRSCRQVVRVCKRFTVAVIIVVPRVCGVAVESLRPEHNFVDIMHSILVIILVNVIAGTVVIVIEWCYEIVWQSAKFNGVGNTITVPIIVSPVDDSIVVMVPSGLFFAPETTRELLLVTIEDTVVVIVWIFTVRNTVVVVVNVVYPRLLQSKRHDTAVPNGLVETVPICVSIVSIVVVVDTVAS